MTFWIVNILNGVSLAMILFLLASGLTLVFGLMRIVNMVHGSFYLLGGYIALSVMQGSGYFVLGAVVSFVLVAALGMGIQRMFLSKLYKQELPQALLTLGLLFVFADVAFWIWAGNPVMLPQPALFSGTVQLFGIPYPTYRLFLIGAVWGLRCCSGCFSRTRKLARPFARASTTRKCCAASGSTCRCCSPAYLRSAPASPASEGCSAVLCSVSSRARTSRSCSSPSWS